jgi:DEAD/DEAH box helicase
MEAQFAELAGNPDVIVATPGRLAHHLAEVAGFGLKTVEYIVFDEADRRGGCCRCASGPPLLGVLKLSASSMPCSQSNLWTCCLAFY